MADHRVVLKDRRDVAEGTMAFTFEMIEGTFTFEAGQNIDLTLANPPETDAEGNTRTFSFCSSPTHVGEFSIATRMRDTAFKRVLKTLPLGTELKAVGPQGDMTLHEDSSRPAVFIAGGIGITPFRSLIEWMTVTKQPHDVTLLYSNRTPAQTAFLSDLESWAALNQKFHFVPTVTDSDDASWKYEHGRIDEAFIRKHVPNVAQSTFYIAGPPGMNDAMQVLLKTMKISKDYIKTESFSGY